MITGGERSDMILAALERDTIGIILTNDIVPIIISFPELKRKAYLSFL